MTLNIDKEINLLQVLNKELYSKHFDLESWKSRTVVVLEKIFGAKDERINKIRNIVYDHSSWSLRDTIGTDDNLDSCRKAGKDIIDAIIFELENYGVPSTDVTKNESILSISQILEILDDELKGSQLKQLKSIISTESTDVEKKEKLVGLIKEFGVDVAPEILARLLLSNPLRESI